MKRKIAKRKLKRTCLMCRCQFAKGDIYHMDRTVYEDAFFEVIVAYEHLYCPRCKYKKEDHKQRYEHFKLLCHHPPEFVETVWTMIPGEAVEEPSHDECMLCGQKI